MITSRQNPDEVKPPRCVRILHAEDVLFVSQYVARFFTAKGYVVETAADGEEALAKARRLQGYYDVVITDYAMPKLTGLQFVAALRLSDQMVKIVVFAASLTSETENQFRALGVSHIVRKSDSLLKLDHAVGELLRTPMSDGGLI